MKNLFLCGFVAICSLQSSSALAWGKEVKVSDQAATCGAGAKFKPGDVVEYVVYKGARPQYLEVQLNGQVIEVPGVGSTKIKVCTGKNNCTPTVRARITAVDSHESTIFHCWLPNFQRIGDSKIGIHGGQDVIGKKGTPVLDYPASHGCIRANNTDQLAALSKNYRRVVGFYPMADVRDSAGAGQWNDRVLATAPKRSRAD